MLKLTDWLAGWLLKLSLKCVDSRLCIYMVYMQRKKGKKLEYVYETNMKKGSFTFSVVVSWTELSWAELRGLIRLFFPQMMGSIYRKRENYGEVKGEERESDWAREGDLDSELVKEGAHWRLTAATRTIFGVISSTFCCFWGPRNL